MAQTDEAMRALESLTPGGSEYVGDVAACVAAVRDRLDSQHRVILRATKECRAAQRERDAFVAELQKTRAQRDALLAAAKLTLGVIEKTGVTWPEPPPLARESFVGPQVALGVAIADVEGQEKAVAADECRQAEEE